jgi:hypothetical protein
VGRSLHRPLQPPNIAVDAGWMNAGWMEAPPNVLQAGGPLRCLFGSKNEA